MSDYFILHSCVQVVRGASRALILDTQHRKYWMVPLSFADFVEAIDKSIPDTFFAGKGKDEVSEGSSYLEFLIGNKLGFYCGSLEELDCFPAINMEWKIPFEISNAVIELNDIENFSVLQSAIEDVYIPYIQFVITHPVETEAKLEVVIAQLRKLPFKTCQLLFRTGIEIPSTNLEGLCRQYPFIEMLCVFNATEEIHIDLHGAIIIKTQQPYWGHQLCGIVHTAYFNPQLLHYTESLHHNTCLNRKISIDAEGNIKNCPSMKENFGNIRDTTLREALNKPGFKKYWNITKDQISVCKDCEFRHVCTDCRAYVENPDDDYSKPLKCGYDPYTCTWEEWSKHPLKQQAVTHYGLGALQ